MSYRTTAALVLVCGLMTVPGCGINPELEAVASESAALNSDLAVTSGRLAMLEQALREGLDELESRDDLTPAQRAAIEEGNAQVRAALDKVQSEQGDLLARADNVLAILQDPERPWNKKVADGAGEIAALLPPPFNTLVGLGGLLLGGGIAAQQKRRRDQAVTGLLGAASMARDANGGMDWSAFVKAQNMTGVRADVEKYLEKMSRQERKADALNVLRG